METTLRTNAAIEQARLAADAGFVATMRFVATDSIAENVARVLQRAQAGGHAAFEREIRAIHGGQVLPSKASSSLAGKRRLSDAGAARIAHCATPLASA